VLVLRNESASAGLGFYERAADVVHCAARNADLTEARLPLATRRGEEYVLHPCNHLFAVFETTLARCEARCRQWRVADRVGKAAPHAVVTDEQREVAVGSAEVLRRHQRRVCGVRGAREVCVPVALPRCEVSEHGDLHVEEPEVDVRADPGTRPLHERRADPQRGADAATVVDVGDSGFRRRSFGLARQAHDPRQSLDGVVVSGTLRVGASLSVTRQ
jgi:hypothetical protein